MHPCVFFFSFLLKKKKERVFFADLYSVCPLFWNSASEILKDQLWAGLLSRSQWSRMFSAGVGVGFQNCWSRRSESVF